MKQSLRKFISSALTVSTSLALTGIGMVGTVHAGTLTSVKATLSNPVGGQAATHTVAFKIKDTTAIHKVELSYQQAPSGTGSTSAGTSWAATTPVVALSTINNSTSGTPGADWDEATSGNVITLTRNAGAGDISGLSEGNEIILGVSGINNNSATSNDCDAIADSETCYIKITTKNASDGVIDTAITSYTVISNITVSATVDPSLTFTVAAVNAANLTTNDNQAGTCTAVTTTATTIPFGNVSVNVPKCGQQSLTVKTNAQNGYFVYNKFTGAEIMSGVYSGNNIDPFTAASATWDGQDEPDAKAWASPTGTTKNVDTGWLGVRSKNGGYTFGNDSWAPASNAAGTGKKVVKNAGPSLGTTPVYVTYKFEVNALQPSDTYEGSMVYNVVATY